MNMHKQLAIAIRNRQIERIEQLIRNGALSCAPTPSGFSPLDYASNYGIEVVECLIRVGPPLDMKDLNGYTSLHHAALRGDLMVVDCLIRAGALLDSRTNFDLTPLHCAALNGNTTVAELLICSGAPIDSNDGTYKSTPLHYAVRNNRVEIVKLLLEYGANFTIENQDGETAKFLSQKGGNTEICELFEIVEENFQQDVKEPEFH